jgi:ABC-type multidrug transport system fused ATPase/permease subunit
MNKELLGYTIGAVLFVALLIVQPYLIIWAINHVFSLGVTYTFESWLAVMILNFTWMHKGAYGVQKVQIVEDKNVKG